MNQITGDKKIFNFYLIFASLFLIILTPALFTDGMFMDGTIYAVLSRNLAEGNGTFWHLHFSDTLLSDFKEHPPLAFYLGSLLFKLLGDNIFTERIYSLFTGVITAVLIALAVKTFDKNRGKEVSLISLFVWLSFPLVNWTYANNMLENTMTVFILISTVFVLKSLKNDKNKTVLLLLSGIFLFAAFMSKGFPALFVWGIIFFYYFVFKEISFKRMVSDTLLLIFFTVLPLALIFLFSEEAKESLLRYFTKQVVGSIVNVKTVNNRFYIIVRMLKEMIIPLIFVFILFIIAKIKKNKIKLNKPILKKSLFFFLIALSGTAPIMITLKQRAFYIVPALPFSAIALAYFILNFTDAFSGLKSFFNKKIFIPISYGLSAISIILVFVLAGKPGRDKKVLHDVYKIAKRIPENKIISICKTTYSDWSLHAYLQRYGKISMSDKVSGKYFLNDGKCSCDSDYKKDDTDLILFTLYEKKH